MDSDDSDFLKDFNSNSLSRVDTVKRKHVKEEDENPPKKIKDNEEDAFLDEILKDIDEKNLAKKEDNNNNLETTSKISFAEKLTFFLFDMVESPRFSQQKSVYFFGKLLVNQKYVNCSVRLLNPPRVFYLQISQGQKAFTPQQIIDSFERLLLSFVEVHFEKSKSVDKKSVLRNILNNHVHLSVSRKTLIPSVSQNVDLTCTRNDYLSVIFENPEDKFYNNFVASFLTFLTNKNNLMTSVFCSVHNHSASTTECCVLLLDVHGPSFYEMDNFVQVTDSKNFFAWSELQFVVPSFRNIKKVASNELTLKLKPPPISLLFIDENTNTHSNSNKVITLNYFPNCENLTAKKTFSYTFNESQRNVMNTGLTWLFNKFSQLDADIVFGYRLVDYLFKFFINYSRKEQRNDYSKLSRMRSVNFVRSIDSTFGKLDLPGRVVIDLNLVFRELLPYDVHLSPEEIYQKYLNKTLSTNKSNMFIQLLAHFQVVPLFTQISTICGCLLSKCFLSGRAERNEYLLLHAFFKNDIILDDVQTSEISNNKGYEGGLVLEPRRGFYRQYILLMDFNSLYPSVIKEFDVCFTTYNSATKDCVGGGQESYTSILPNQIHNLINRRKEVKRLIANERNPQQRTMLDIRQKALKLIANSIYGCLGFSQSRFYAPHLAALITAKGREILMNAKSTVEALGFEVIYGDTDSLMVNTHTNELHIVHEISKQIKQAVNSQYTHLELDCDGIYKPLLMLRKKKYAAKILVSNSVDEANAVFEKQIKGLDLIRHDWSKIARNVGSVLLDILLDQQYNYDMDLLYEKVVAYLSGIIEDVKTDRVPMAEYEISRVLQKRLDQYQKSSNVKSLPPHVHVAIRMNAANGNKVTYGVNDAISYIICNDGSSNSAMQRAYHLSEVANSGGSLKVDVEYYMKSQIYPVISRMLEVIAIEEGFIINGETNKNNNIMEAVSKLFSVKYTDSSRDAQSYLNSKNAEFDFRNDPQLFKYPTLQCDNSKCTNYKTKVIINCDFVETKNFQSKCGECAQEYELAHFFQSLSELIDDTLDKHYRQEKRCDSSECNFTLINNNISTDSKCPKCVYNKRVNSSVGSCGELQLQYSKNYLFQQLSLLEFLSAEMCKKFDKNDLLKQIHEYLTHIMLNNNYNMLDIGSLIQCL